MFFVLRLIIAGFVIGWAARFIYPGDVAMGWIGSILLGLAGSLLGGLLAQMFSHRRAGQPLEPAGCLGSVLGAMLLIFLGRHLDLF